MLAEANYETIIPENLFTALYHKYGEVNNNEKVKRIKHFAVNNNIDLINKTFYAHTVKYDEVKSLDKPILINTGGDKLLPEEVFVIHMNYDKTRLIDKKIRFSENQIKHISRDDMDNECRLINDFKSGKRWLYYPEIWGILTNLVHISGGIKYFRSIIEYLEEHRIHPYAFDKWYSNCTQISKCPYAPMRCEDFCPYHDKCRHGKNILTTINITKESITILDNSINYVDKETARYQLYGLVRKAILSNDTDIHIIKAQTGLGKTYAYIECIKDLKINCIIAVPTNNLKEEVCNRIKNAGINAKMTPALPEDIEKSDRQRLEDIYRKGDLDGYKKYMSILSKKYSSIKDYISQMKDALNYEGTIVTTHFRLLYQLRSKTLDNHTIIIDEDILQTMFHTERIKLSEIKYLLGKSYIRGEQRKRLRYYIRKKDDKIYKKHIAEPQIYLSRKIRKIKSKDPEIDFNAENFLNSKATRLDEENGVVYYAWLKELPAQKVIIMSATADEKVYAEFFKNRHIQSDTVDEVIYKGQLLQWTDNSYSRNWINNNTEEFNSIRNKYKDMDCHEICFKKHKIESSPLHFGNTQGKDIFADKNLVVLGTPFPSEIVCRLMAAAMDGNTEAINNDTINFRKISYDKYRFYFSTFEYSLLQSIHIYLISSELEQAIGRARLLNNDNNVYVYSWFPAKQASFQKIEKNKDI